MNQQTLIDDCPLADLWEAPQSPAEAQPDHEPLPIKPANHCLHCGKPSAGMFCNRTCRAKWISSMAAFDKRISKTTIKGSRPLQFGE